MDNPLTPLAQVVRVSLKAAGISENAASTRSGIPRTTLRSRLVTGDFKYESELWPIARLLGTTPSELQAKAEGRAA